MLLQFGDTLTPRLYRRRPRGTLSAKDKDEYRPHGLDVDGEETTGKQVLHTQAGTFRV